MILTVEQLIKELSKLPPNSVPYVYDGGKGVDYDTGICEVAWVGLTKPNGQNYK
jgi:hypothetical protein